MSNKRPLSPEPTNVLSNNENIRSLKRLKLHSIIQELRNEEANLVLLKKLRSCQQSANRTNNNNTNNTNAITAPVTTNGFYSAAARVPTNKPSTPVVSSSANSLLSRSSLPQPLSSATRKPGNIINAPLPTKIPTPLPTKPSSAIQSLEERKTQAKKALRNQLERDLLNIPSPKPLIQDILFIPNLTSLEFLPYMGLEDVVQCLSELQTDRQRLPQRFTDRAQVDEPNICEHCGIDYTIRWWKHLNNNQQINILCDRCKKQVTRRTAKSEHSALLKNVFVSAMEQEKEIDKTFQVLIKQQQKSAPRSVTPSSTSSSPSAAAKLITNNRPVPSVITSNHTQSNNNHHNHHQNNNNHHQQHHHQHQKPKIKTPIPHQAQNFATKLSQQPKLPINAARKSSPIIPPQINATNNIRSLPQTKSPMPTHQQYRPTGAIPQQQQQQQTQKINQLIKAPKTAVRQSPVAPSRPIFPPAGGIIPPSTMHPSLSSSANARPTATKRRTLPSVNIK